MIKWKLEQLNLHDLGNTIQIAGAVYADSEVLYLCLFPDEKLEGKEVRLLELSQDDWEKVVRQTDLLETEVLTNSSDGKLAKIVVRKSTRQIEQGVSWRVYRRDKFKCRYCGIDNVPLTVDHIITWESGGPSIEANLLTSCRKCNKVRGETPYTEWLSHPFYVKVSNNLTEQERAENVALISTLNRIPRVYHPKSR